MSFIKKLIFIIFILVTFGLAQTSDGCLELTYNTTVATWDTRLKTQFTNAQKKNIPCVFMPKGDYTFAKPIQIPAGMYLMGTYDDINHHSNANFNTGTRINCTAGAGSDSTAFDKSCIIMQKDAGIKGITLSWPLQTNVIDNPTKYPWGITCLGNGGSCKIENVLMTNAYNGVYLYQSNNNYIHNLNMAILRRGMVIDGTTTNFGTIHNVNIHDQYIWTYYGWITDVWPYDEVQTLENVRLYKNMVGIEFKNSVPNGNIIGTFVFKARIGYKFDFNNSATTNIFTLQNSGCDLCNFAVHIKNIGTNNILDYINSQAFGKINIESTAKGQARFINSQLSYYVTEYEDNIAAYSHVNNNSKDFTIWITNADITTAGMVGHPFKNTVLFNAGTAYLRNVNLIDPYMYAEAKSPNNPNLSWLFSDVLDNYKTFDEVNGRHFLLQGDDAAITALNGYALGYNDYRPIYYTTSGKVITDGAKMPGLNTINLMPKGQWTSKYLTNICRNIMPSATSFLCNAIDNDPDWRYKPRLDDSDL